MYNPTYVQLKYWYYPVGNTPAVNLARDSSGIEGSKKHSSILSLACGDVRNVMFTLWCEQRNGRLIRCFDAGCLHEIQDLPMHSDSPFFLLLLL